MLTIGLLKLKRPIARDSWVVPVNPLEVYPSNRPLTGSWTKQSVKNICVSPKNAPCHRYIVCGLRVHYTLSCLHLPTTCLNPSHKADVTGVTCHDWLQS